MSSVTQKESRAQQRSEAAVARDSLVLFCCCLFLFWQLCSSFFPSFESRGSSGNRHLVISESRSENRSHTSGVLSLGQAEDHTQRPGHRFGPFFFTPVPINYCDRQLLMTVKGIGPGLADKILATRKKIGAFRSDRDLLLVDGIGPVRLKQLSHSFSFD